MLGLSPGIKISISSKSGHSTFVLSTTDVWGTSNTHVFKCCMEWWVWSWGRYRLHDM